MSTAVKRVKLKYNTLMNGAASKNATLSHLLHLAAHQTPFGRRFHWHSVHADATGEPPWVDASKRCLFGGICLGEDACALGGPLGCMEDLEARREAIVNATLWAWRGYREWAFGADEVDLVRLKEVDWFGMGLTIVDSLDTLLLMAGEFPGRLQPEVEEAADFVLAALDIAPNRFINVFEATIRLVGGLLGAFTLTEDLEFLERAAALWHRLQPAFHGRKVPHSDVNPATGEAKGPHWGPFCSLSEATTLTLEGRTLARLLDNPEVEEGPQHTLRWWLVEEGQSGVLKQILIETSTHEFA